MRRQELCSLKLINISESLKIFNIFDRIADIQSKINMLNKYQTIWSVLQIIQIDWSHSMFWRDSKIIVPFAELLLVFYASISNAFTFWMERAVSKKWNGLIRAEIAQACLYFFLEMMLYNCAIEHIHAGTKDITCRPTCKCMMAPGVVFLKASILKCSFLCFADLLWSVLLRLGHGYKVSYQ